MKILILSMILTCCGLAVTDHKLAQLKRSKGFSMIIRSEQGKRLANHLIELEIITYLNHKTVQLSNGVGVRGQEIADYLGISNKTVVKHLQNSELDLQRVRRAGREETVWVYNGTKVLPADALQINGIADIPYNHQPIIKFFTNANITQKLQDGVAVSTVEVAQAIGEVPNKQFNKRIKFLRAYLGIVPVHGFQPRDGIWQREGVKPKQLPQAFEESQLLERIRQFLTTPAVKAKLADGSGISSQEIRDALNLSLKKYTTYRYVNRLKDELDIKILAGPHNTRLWVDKAVADINREPTVTELLREFLARPEIIAKLENGEGITSRFIAASLGVALGRITSSIGNLKDEFNLEQVITRSGEDNIWTRRSAELTAVRKNSEADVLEAFAEFFNRPDIAQQLTNGYGITSREIKDGLNLNKSAYAITKYLVNLTDELSIKIIRKDNGGVVWIHKDTSYIGTERLPPTLRQPFPSGLTLEEFFAQPAVVARMTDGRGIAIAEIAEALGHSQGAGSLGQMLRHSAKYLGIKSYARRGDQKRLWMRDGIEPIPNYKKALKRATPAADK